MGRILIICIYLLLAHSGISQELLRTNSANIHFVSDAPLEFIEAKSDKCQGILNLDNGEFAFRIYIKAFDGFNSPLQKVHFFENYMEVSQFPDATFVGKMVEKINPDDLATADYRAKGILKIHGVENEVILPIKLTRTAQGLNFSCKFKVELVDYNIEIPTIVKQKIAESIRIEVTGNLSS